MPRIESHSPGVIPARGESQYLEDLPIGVLMVFPRLEGIPVFKKDGHNGENYYWEFQGHRESYSGSARPIGSRNGPGTGRLWMQYHYVDIEFPGPTIIESLDAYA